MRSELARMHRLLCHLRRNWGFLVEDARMSAQDPYADRTHDDCNEVLCTATPLANPHAASLFAAAADIARTAATTLPPELPPTV